MEKNVERKENYEQVCVWHGVLLDENGPEGFEKFIMDEFKTRIQYLETIETKPDLDGNFNPVPETGGRHDVFFAVHNEDIGNFAIPRLQAGIRWIEDVLSRHNYQSPIYPHRVYEYKTWEA